MTTYSLTIPGTPIGKARPRITRGGIAYTPKETKNYETFIRELFALKHGSIMLRGDIKATLTAYFGLNKSDYNKTGLTKTGKRKLAGEVRPSKKPDIDNIVKAVLDSLNGIAYIDDSQVVVLAVEKHYAEQPRVEIVLSEIAEEVKS